MTHALFGGPSSGGGSTSRHLVEFKAGKLTLKNGWVTPINKKGLVYVHQSDDGLMHLCWKDRTSGTVEDDLIIFPDDIEFKKVTQCTTGRVYLLRFKSSSKKFFFWMQEPKDDKDADICRKVNDFLNNPPAPAMGNARGGASSAGSIANALSGLGESDLSGMLGNMSQAELMQLLQMSMQMGMGGQNPVRPQSGASDSSEQMPSRVQSSPGERTTTTEASSLQQPRPVTAIGNTNASSLATDRAASASAAQGGRIQLSDLQSILSSIAPTDKKPASLDLNDVLPAEKLIPLLADPDVQKRLIPHLPEETDIPRTTEELRASVTSPQFRQCVSAFSAAILTGEMGPVISQFGLGAEATQAANEGDLQKFIKALQGEASDAEMTDAQPPAEKMDET